MAVKLDAKTIVALTGLVSVLLGGIEMRLELGNIKAKLERVEERTNRIEHQLVPRLAQRDGDLP